MEKSKPVVKKGLYTLPIWCMEVIINYGEAKQFFPTEYSRGTEDKIRKMIQGKMNGDFYRSICSLCITCSVNTNTPHSLL